MPLRVAFDLDGTVADLSSVLRREAEAEFGSGLAADAARPADGAEPHTLDVPPTTVVMERLRLKPRQQQRVWERVSAICDFWTTLPEMEPGIIARIARVAQARRWEIIFLTTRPPTMGETTQTQSQRWLASHGFPYPSVFVVQHSRGRVADALQLDAVVDDRIENCLDIALGSQAKAILVRPGESTHVPAATKGLGVRVVSSISAALALLERYDDERTQPALVRSLNRLLGRESPLSAAPAPQNRRAGDRRRVQLGAPAGIGERRTRNRRHQP